MKLGNIKFFLRVNRMVISLIRPRRDTLDVGKRSNPTKFGQLARRIFFTTYKKELLVLGLLPGVKIAFCAKELVSQPPLRGSQSKDDDVLRTADMYYEKNQIKELFDFLSPYEGSDKAELVWRLARATYELAKAEEAKEDEKKRLTYAAFRLSEKALSLDEKNFACHKWFAILLDEIGKYEGVKYRLKRSPEVKEHFERSIELNPNDPTSHHCLGYWHFSFADLAWYQRKAAEAFFASPPTSTYHEAIDCFERAEKVQPNFYSMNLLMLGKAYLKVGDFQSAGHWLTKLRDFPAQTAEDEKAKKECVKLWEQARLRMKFT